MSKIEAIKARKILNSRGEWTIEVLISSENFKVKAGVPGGASTGKFEAKTIEVDKAIENVNEIIAPKLKNLDPRKQKEIDDLLIHLDKTEDKSNLGANAIVGVSMATCRLGAKVQKIPLWEHIKNISEIENKNLKVPYPCFNIINGGAHAGNNLAIQEFMIVSQKEYFSENLAISREIYQRLKNLIKEKLGKIAINVGDEGGFAPPLTFTNEALSILKNVICDETKIILDCAASQFYQNEKYFLERAAFTQDGLLAFYEDLIRHYPIMGLEDPFAQEDFQIWNKINSKFNTQNPELLIIGDDLTVTNSQRIKMAKEKNLCNALIVKINQIGTVSEAIEAVRIAKSFDWKTIVSHRSGETNDDFISDFAVGIGADFIKSGAPARGERVAKYNRLLEIEKELK